MEKEYKIIGNEVEITTPAKVELVDVETEYNQCQKDIVDINFEIETAQARIADAEARKADRLARIALVEPKVEAIKAEREALKVKEIPVEEATKL